MAARGSTDSPPRMGQGKKDKDGNLNAHWAAMKKRMKVVNERLDRAKQRVDWHTGIKGWVLFDDVYEEVWNLKAGAETAQDIQK